MAVSDKHLHAMGRLAVNFGTLEFWAAAATWSLLEAGITRPYARTVRQLAEVLGVEPAALADPLETAEPKKGGGLRAQAAGRRRRARPSPDARRPVSISGARP